MPTEHLGHIHHNGKSLYYTQVFMRIIAPLRGAVERLAVHSLLGRGVATSARRSTNPGRTDCAPVRDASIGSGNVRAGA